MVMGSLESKWSTTRIVCVPLCFEREKVFVEMEVCAFMCGCNKVPKE